MAVACYGDQARSMGRHADDVLEQIQAIVGDNLVYAIDTFNAGKEQVLGIAALSNSKKGTLITLRRSEGEFGPDQIGTKKAGYEGDRYWASHQDIRK